MSLRLPYYELSSELLGHFIQVNTLLEKSSLNETSKNIVELIYVRISQMNGCPYCLDLHCAELRKKGETTKRIDALAGWRVSDLYTAKERSALEWAESLTLIAGSRDIADESFNNLKKEFSDKEISDLTFSISLMNAFNRIAISMRR